MGQIRDVADGSLLLESSPYTTCEILHIDGGQVAGHWECGSVTQGVTVEATGQCRGRVTKTADTRMRGVAAIMGVKSEIEKADIRFGPGSLNRLAEAADASVRGAPAALESFYYAWHHPDADALRAVCSDSPRVQPDNPADGILRGGDAIAGLYHKALASPANVRVIFGDVVAYHGQSHAVFAGRETGSYTAPDGTAMPLEIRTTRYFRHQDGRWRQYHHHGSIDDPEALRAYQQAIRG